VAEEPSLPHDRNRQANDETGCNNSSDSTFCVGLRVVRGPDWKSNEAGRDGGEGFVGTVVEVGSDSSSLAENMAVVQWDIGTRGVYKAGYHNKCEISVLDNSSVGIKHRRRICCACKQGPIAGMRWKCFDCKDSSLDLCTSCYMTDKHEKEHVFLRFDAPDENGTPLGGRSTTNKIQAKGIYANAIVSRGPDWKYGEEDGRSFGTVTEITNWQGNPACAARVAWASGTESTYRLGYQGKVDLLCVTPGSGGYYYKSHLPRLCLSQTTREDTSQPGSSSDGDADTLTASHSSESAGSVFSESDDIGIKASKELVAAYSSFSADAVSQKLTTDWERRAEEAKASRTALHKASIGGRWRAVKMLLEHGEDANQGDKFSLTSLHLAAWYGQETIVKLLLEYGANVNATDKFQKTPLQKAERQNHQSITQILKEHGATSSYYQPPSLISLCKMAVLTVDRSSGFNLLQAATFEGDCDKFSTVCVFVDNLVREMNFESTANNAKILPSKTACDIFSTLEKQEHAKLKEFYEEASEKIETLSKLHHCGDIDDTEMAVELVLHHGVDVNIPAKGNRTPLLWASLRCSNVCTKTLIDLGADTNAQREDQCTPLVLATYWNNYMAAHVLVKTGVDIDAQEEGHNTALHIAANKGFVNTAQLLIESGCNVNLKNSSGKTPLHLGVQNKHKHLVNMLLENNADVSIRDKHDPKEKLFLVRGKNKGKPAWHYVEVDRTLLGLFDKRMKIGSIRLTSFGTVLASGWGKDPPDNKRREVRARVDAKYPTETKDKTALHVACEVSEEPIIELLVKHGADVNVLDADGFSPLHLAAIHGNMQVVKKLVDLKADVNLTTADGKDAADYANLNEETEIEEYLKSKRGTLRKLWNKLSRKH